MRAARWYGARDVRVESMDRPRPRVGQVLVAVEMVGLCGTDVEEYVAGPVDIPPALTSGLTLGHEVVGRVAECPGGEIAVGTRVIPDVVQGCGHCRFCRRHEPGLCAQLVVLGLQADGGLAEYLLADASTCIAVDEALAPRAAVFAEPLSVAVRALRKFGDLSGASVAVVGLGTIGNLVVRTAVLRGADALVGIDPLQSRREQGEQAGADTCLHPADVPAHYADHHRAPDLVIECAGTASAVSAAVSMAASGGTVVAVGTGDASMALPVRDLVLHEKRLLGSAAHVWDVDVAAAVSLLERRAVDPLPLIARTVALSDVVAEGFERLVDDPTLGKVLVDCRS